MMMSGNAMDVEEMLEFDKRIKRLLRSEDEVEYVAEVKLDGLSVELVYDHGALTVASTRVTESMEKMHRQHQNDQVGAAPSAQAGSRANSSHLEVRARSSSARPPSSG